MLENFILEGPQRFVDLSEHKQFNIVLKEPERKVFDITQVELFLERTLLLASPGDSMLRDESGQLINFLVSLEVELPLEDLFELIRIDPSTERILDAVPIVEFILFGNGVVLVIFLILVDFEEVHEGFLPHKNLFELSQDVPNFVVLRVLFEALYESLW